MQTRALDKNGDWTILNGKSLFKKGNNALAQIITSKINLVVGEVFYDITQGVNWQYLRSYVSRPEQFISEIEAEILSTEGVVSAELKSTNFDKTLQVVYSVVTIFNDTIDIKINNANI